MRAPPRRHAEGLVRHGCAQTVFHADRNSFRAQHGSSWPFIPIQASLCQPQPEKGRRRRVDRAGERALEMEKKKKEGGLRSQPMRRLLTGSPSFEILPHCSLVPQGGCTTSMVERAFGYREI